MRWRAVRWLLLGVPFVVVGGAERWFVPFAADRIASHWRPLPRILPPSAEPPDDPADEPPDSDSFANPPPDESASSAWPSPAWGAPQPSSPHGRASADGLKSPVSPESNRLENAPPRGVFIPAPQTARMARRAAKRLRPEAVNGQNGRPLGLRLAGAGGLGVGLSDDDVLTSVAGTPTPTLAAAIDAIRGALALGRPRISGTVLRRGETFTLTVEVPRELSN